MESTGTNPFTTSKYDCHWADFNNIHACTADFLNDSYTEFHEYLTSVLATENMLRKDVRGLHTRCSYLTHKLNLKLCTETIATCVVSDTKHTSALYENNDEFLNVKPGCVKSEHGPLPSEQGEHNDYLTRYCSCISAFNVINVGKQN
jgi:hypothetical protein